MRRGDCIGVVAPASHGGGENFSDTVRFLEGLGYRVRFGENAFCQYGYFAGTDEARAADVNTFFLDETVAALLCLRGGYGAARVLDALDYEAIAAHPKLFIGYSDITALHVALHERCGLVTMHGPMLSSFLRGTAYTQQQFVEGIRAAYPLGRFLLPCGRGAKTLASGMAAGRIVGGNLAVVASLVGTPYEIDGRDCLLFLEEVDEAPYRVDRMLQQLWQSGLLRRVNGLIFGDFVRCEGKEPFYLQEVLEYYAKLSGRPALGGIAAGHAPDNGFLPFGVFAVIRCYGGSGDGLFFLEPHAW